MTMPTISIAMATYNGAKYLQGQLDSLAKQSLLPCELVICDDGSQDSTLDIAERFSLIAPFPVHIVRNDENIGYAENFLKAASLCRGDWIAFCDQDDVWFSEKLRTVSSRFKDDVLMVVHSAELTDHYLSMIGRRLPNITKNAERGALKNRLWWTPAGFAQCIASRLMRDFDWTCRPRDFNYPDKLQSHDQWTYFLANTFGTVVYIKDSLAYYRRHVNAATGNYHTSFRDQLKKARAAGSYEYRMLSMVANEYRTMLQHIVVMDNALIVRGESAQKYYLKVSELFRLRSELYSSDRFVDRLKLLCALCRRGAYVRTRREGVGLKALVKDMITLVFYKGT